MPRRMRMLFFALLLAGAGCGGARPVAAPSSGTASPAPAASVAEVLTVSEPEQALLQACEKGDLAAVKALLDKDVNVNARDKDGREPVIEATYWQHANIVRLLIEKGANVNAKKVDGTSALAFAINLHNKEIEQMLRRAGAKSGQDAAGEPNKKEAASASPASTTRK